MKEIWFHDFYKAPYDTTLSYGLFAKFGWTSPNLGPIVAYPVNHSLFPKGIPNPLPANTPIAVPWTQARIRNMIAIIQREINERTTLLKKTIAAIKKNTADVNKVATQVDVIATVLLLNLGLGKAAFEAHKVMSISGAATSVSASTLTEAHAIVKAMAANGTGVTYQGLQTVMGMDPGAFVGREHVWYKTALRHALSLSSPSYWAQLFASAWTGDWDLYKYGTQAVQDRDLAKRFKDFQKEVGGCYARIAALSRQNEMSFYKHRICKSSHVYLPKPFTT